MKQYISFPTSKFQGSSLVLLSTVVRSRSILLSKVDIQNPRGGDPSSPAFQLLLSGVLGGGGGADRSILLILPENRSPAGSIH